jgi:KDO2-lipid IV(A) lauroyltransferase
MASDTKTMRPAEAIVRLVLRCARILPPRFALWLGGQLGHLAGSLPLHEAELARTHLAIAFPGHDAAWHRRTVRRCFRHFGRMALWTFATVHADPRRLRRGMAVEGADNWRALAAACRRGQGTMGMAGHLGNWELLARVSGSVVPLTVIGKRLRSPLADRLVWELRTAGGARLVYQDADVRDTIRELRAGRYVATLPDQDIGRLAGDWVPWFGRTAYTPTGPAVLAQLAGGWVQPGHCVLVARGGYRWTWVAHCGPRVRFTRSADRAGDARTIMAWAMAYQEGLVRRFPEQWVWWHRRWRNRHPSDAGPGDPIPAGWTG